MRQHDLTSGKLFRIFETNINETITFSLALSGKKDNLYTILFPYIK